MPKYCVVLVSLIASLLTACSGSNSTPAPAAPVFTSTPITQAAEGSLYSYQLTASAAAGVTFSLSNAPAGATLSGSTVSWTPTAQQSRAPNSFTVTAAASGGPSTTQSWTVTPSGTIRISHVDTLWNENGSTAKAFDWSPVTSYVAALVPQPDGSFQSFSGTAGTNGAFEIPNVPAGYYWLKLAPSDTYWTSSSTFDVGSDIFLPVAPTPTTTSLTTYFNFSFTSLDPTPGSGLLQVDALEGGMPSYLAATDAGSTSFIGGTIINGTLNYSGIKNLLVRQYEPTSFGSLNGYVMGPELTLSNQSLTAGGHNTIGGSLNPAVPASIRLSVQGSAWTPLFEHIAPATLSSLGGAIYLSVHPYIAADGPNVFPSNPSTPIDLIFAKANSSSILSPAICSANLSPAVIQNSSLMTDVEAGTVQYGDPFPAAWRRTFRVCHTASVDIPMPGGQTHSVSLINTQTTSLPTATVKPLLSAVLNPKINGADLFTPSTVKSAAVTLSWDPPAIGTPFGYTVSIISPTTVSPLGGVLYLVSATLGTAKTSMTLPPDLLSSGKSYLFLITSLVDGKTNMETSPHRSLLPTASAQLVSAPITIAN